MCWHDSFSIRLHRLFTPAIALTTKTKPPWNMYAYANHVLCSLLHGPPCLFTLRTSYPQPRFVNLLPHCYLTTLATCCHVNMLCQKLHFSCFVSLFYCWNVCFMSLFFSFFCPKCSHNVLHYNFVFFMINICFVGWFSFSSEWKYHKRVT